MDRYEYTAEQRALLEGLSQPFAVYQLVDKRVAALILSDGFCELFGYDDRAQAYYDMNNDMYKDTHSDDTARIADAAMRFATEGGSYEVIYRTKDRGTDGYRIVHAMGRHVYTDDGVRLAHVWYTDEGAYLEEGSRRGTELNRVLNNALHEESLLHENFYDYLTGLPSMTYFFELADVAKRTIRDGGKEPVMLYLDLNGMKFFNTQNSFAAGDELLREFAKVLGNAFGKERCCRISADHFVAFDEEVGIEEKLEEFFRSCQAINDGNSLPVRVGIYPNSLEDVHVSTACDRAKFACDLLRNTYESCYGYYDRSLRDAAELRRHILSNFDKAIGEGWIQVHYQPIVRTVNGRVCDEEALSRWYDPVFGLLSPAEFIPVLEDAGLIYRLDLYVLDQILEKMRKQREAGFVIVPHSLNLSRSDFDSCDIVEEILQRVDASGFHRSMISIEITESIIGSDLDFMKMKVERFHELGFPVWLDDFGSGYSSIDLLQSIRFDLIKFDMSFMKSLDEGHGGKIVLTELTRMATALGVETLCEGVETQEQVRFLQDIGCSRLQGFYFCKAIPFEELVKRYAEGVQIGYENPDESPYYDAIGSVSLYDLDIIMNDEDSSLQNYFSTLPMCVMETDADGADFVRINQSYRDFFQRFFGIDIEENASGFSPAPFGSAPAFMRQVQRCCRERGREFFDETMPNGSVVHSFIRYIGHNPVNGRDAVAVAVLSISDEDEGTTYASIARALAADYYNIYYVDLDTERYIEYSSPIGEEGLAMELHGEGFFESSKRSAKMRIYERDQAEFLARFTKENLVAELDTQGAFTATYRLIEGGKPVYASMKAVRMRPGSNQVIIGVSFVDSQMKQQELAGRIQLERDVLKRVIALSGSYLVMYSIDPETGRYFEYGITDEFRSLGYAKEGEDFFLQARIDAQSAICPDDQPGFLEWIAKENILKELQEHGACSYQYRLVMPDGLKRVSLRIARVEESGGEKLVAGVRAWQERRSRDDEDA